MLIHLLRHAQPQVVDGDFYGAALSPAGISETLRLLASGDLARPDVLVSSPFLRALETAALCAKEWGLPLDVDDDFGEWRLQMMNLDVEAYAAEEAAGWRDFDLVVAGGESLSQTRERGLAAVRGVVDSYPKAREVVVVAHGTIIDQICCGIGGRQASINDIRGMKNLARATLRASDGALTLLRDIVEPLE